MCMLKVAHLPERVCWIDHESYINDGILQPEDTEALMLQQNETEQSEK